MRGDIAGTGIGTITHVTGNRFLAFGHRRGLGEVELEA
jgi:hypothetical protein